MIKTNLVFAKYMGNEKGNDNNGKIKAIKSISEMLSQIDHRAEVVPENNKDMFVRLLTSLKEEILNIDEMELVEEIVNY